MSHVSHKHKAEHAVIKPNARTTAGWITVEADKTFYGQPFVRLFQNHNTSSYNNNNNKIMIIIHAYTFCNVHIFKIQRITHTHTHTHTHTDTHTNTHKHTHTQSYIRKMGLNKRFLKGERFSRKI